LAHVVKSLFTTVCIDVSDYYWPLWYKGKMLRAEGGMGTGAPLATGAESIIIVQYKHKTELLTATERPRPSVALGEGGSEGAHNTVLFQTRRADTGTRFRLITP